MTLLGQTTCDKREIYVIEQRSDTLGVLWTPRGDVPDLSMSPVASSPSAPSAASLSALGHRGDEEKMCSGGRAEC